MTNHNNKKIRIGIIGRGFAQSTHIPAFRSDGRCEVAAIASGDPEKASETAKKLGIPKVFGSWQDMLNSPEIDAVSIAVPPSVQGEIAIKAFLAGKAVFCEKPLSIDMDSGRKIVEASVQAGTANMIDLEFPEILEWKKAKSILERGDIGTLRHIVVSWDIETYSNKKGLDSWKTRTDEGGGTLNQFASHVFYYLEWFVGPITSLSCRMHKAPGDTRRTDTLNIISAKTASGCALSVTISTHSIPGGGHRIEFYGSEGTMVLENTSSDHINGFKIFTAKRGTSKIEETCQHSLSAPDPDSRIAPVSCLVNRFLDWIETGIPQRPDLKDSLRVQQLLDAARRSNGSEQRIEVNK